MLVGMAERGFLAFFEKMPLVVQTAYRCYGDSFANLQPIEAPLKLAHDYGVIKSSANDRNTSVRSASLIHLQVAKALQDSMFTGFPPTMPDTSRLCADNKRPEPEALGFDVAENNFSEDSVAGINLADGTTLGKRPRQDSGAASAGADGIPDTNRDLERQESEDADNRNLDFIDILGQSKKRKIVFDSDEDSGDNASGVLRTAHMATGSHDVEMGSNPQNFLSTIQDRDAKDCDKLALASVSQNGLSAVQKQDAKNRDKPAFVRKFKLPPPPEIAPVFTHDPLKVKHRPLAVCLSFCCKARFANILSRRRRSTSDLIS